MSVYGQIWIWLWDKSVLHACNLSNIQGIKMMSDTEEQLDSVQRVNQTARDHITHKSQLKLPK